MIRILVDGIIFDSYPHGGIGRFFREIMRRICERSDRIQFYVLCTGAAVPHIPRHPRVHPLVFHAIDLPPFRFFNPINLWRKKLYVARIGRMRLHLFHSTYYTLPPFPGLKTVASIHDLIDYQYPYFSPNGRGFCERQLDVVSKADRVISVSMATADSAVAAFSLDRDKITTVYHGASTVFTPCTSEEAAGFRKLFTRGRPFFLFVGSTSSYKNLGTVLRAFAKVAVTTAHLLVIAGHSVKAAEPWNADLAIQLRIEDKILNLSRPTDDVLRIAYGAASAFVFPSLQEGFGIPLLEAMSCGTPIVASDIAVFHEVCGDVALYFDPHSATGLANCLKLALDSQVSSRLRRAGYLRSRDFSWDSTAERVERVYLDLFEQLG